MRKGIKYSLVLAVLIEAIGCGEGDTSNISINDRYELPWKSPGAELLQIGKVLVANKITGCGELYVRRRKTGDNEYLVACTRDTKNWRYYVVKTNESTVEGPLTDRILSPY